MSESSLPSFVEWSSFPFEGVLRVKKSDQPVELEPPRLGEDPAECPKCQAPDDAYIWVNENWRVRSLDRPSGLPMVLILESRSHLDLGDLPNMLAAELGVMTVRLERAIRSIDGVARVHVNRWGDGAAHLHLWFMARPYGQLQLRGTFLTMWDEILPPIPEPAWRANLALVAAWLAEFGGEPLAKPPRIDWKAPSSLEQMGAMPPPEDQIDVAAAGSGTAGGPGSPAAPPATRQPEPAPPETAPPIQGVPVVAPAGRGPADAPAPAGRSTPAPGPAPAPRPALAAETISAPGTTSHPGPAPAPGVVRARGTAPAPRPPEATGAGPGTAGRPGTGAEAADPAGPPRDATGRPGEGANGTAGGPNGSGAATATAGGEARP